MTALVPGSSPTEAPPLPAQRLLIDVPPHYDLVRLVQRSESSLSLPLVFDAAQAALQAVLYPMSEAPIEVLIHQIQPGVPLLVFGIPEGPLAEPLVAQLRTMLALDEDLSMFYALADHDRGLLWVREQDAARRLRSPTVFEDLVKCLLKARAAPSRVQPLIAGLCSELGAATNLARAAFPTALAMATAPARLYERKLKAGPLAAPLRALAQCCASGAFYPESLRRPPRRFSDFFDDEQELDGIIGEDLEWQFRLESLLSRLPGFGPRARDLMLPLVGCYDRLSSDMATLRAWQKRFRTIRGPQAKLAHGQPETTRLLQAMSRRVAPFSLFGGLAQRLLLHGDGVW